MARAAALLGILVALAIRFAMDARADPAIGADTTCASVVGYLDRKDTPHAQESLSRRQAANDGPRRRGHRQGRGEPPRAAQQGACGRRLHPGPGIVPGRPAADPRTDRLRNLHGASRPPRSPALSLKPWGNQSLLGKIEEGTS